MLINKITFYFIEHILVECKQASCVWRQSRDLSFCLIEKVESLLLQINQRASFFCFGMQNARDAAAVCSTCRSLLEEETAINVRNKFINVAAAACKNITKAIRNAFPKEMLNCYGQVIQQRELNKRPAGCM